MVQITFVTLLLGLVSGAFPVKVAVSGPVAAVELRLDGEPLGRLEEPPWEWDVDLGSALIPHGLEARAFDADGSEIAREQQWINLPHPPAEVAVAVEGDPTEGSAAVRLSWSTLIAEAPESVSLSLDGRPLVMGRDGRANLPRLDLEIPHLLTAAVAFGSGIEARRDVVLGAEGAQASSELTAVPVVLRRGKLPPREKLQGWLAAGSTPLKVVASEAAPRQILVVRDAGANELLGLLAGPLAQEVKSDPRTELRVGNNLRFLSARPRSREGEESSIDLFDSSRDFVRQDGGIYRLLGTVVFPGEASRSQHLADAVAVAGLQASAGNHPRAVVLLLSHQPMDASQYTPAIVRSYLAALHVPLHVWSILPSKEDSPDKAELEISPAAQAWGAAETISSREEFAVALTRLQKELAHQRIVFLEGLHLPQSVRVTPAATGLAMP